MSQRKLFVVNKSLIFSIKRGLPYSIQLLPYKFLEVVQSTDIAAMLRQLPECKAIVTTGQKATDTLRMQFNVEEPKVGDFSEFVFENRPIRLYRMPSSSRAYPLALDKKAAAYRIMYQDLQML